MNTFPRLGDKLLSGILSETGQWWPKRFYASRTAYFIVFSDTNTVGVIKTKNKTVGPTVLFLVLSLQQY